MKKKSRLLIYCVALLMLCTAVFFLLRPRDFYDLTYDDLFAVYGEDLELKEMLSANGLADGSTNYIGIILKTDMFNLKKGDYTVTIRYSNTGIANSCELYSPFHIAMDNTPGKVFARHTLDITPQGESSFSFTLDDPAKYLELHIIYTGGDIHIDNIQVTREGVYFTDAIFAALIVAFFGAVAIYLYMKEDKKPKTAPGRFGLSRFQAYLLFLALAVLASLPLFRESYIATHDGLFHLARINGIADALSLGQFPVRINPDYALGRGFAEPVMYPDLFFYIPGIIRLCGSSLLFAYKSFCFMINVATAMIAYYCFKRLLRSDFMGLIAAVLYVFALYRIVDLYTRGALGEFIAMAFLPLVILGMYEVVYGDEKKYKFLVIGFCGLLGSHILSVILCCLFCAVFVLCNLKKILQKPRLAALAKSAGLVVLLNIWFLIPMFTYYGIGLRLFNTANIAEHRVRIPQLFQTFVNAYGSSEYLDSSNPEMSLSVGGILAAACLVYICCMWKMRKDKDAEAVRLFKIGNYSLAFSVAALIISSTLFPWGFIYDIPIVGRFLTMVQFPWRYLMVATVFMCVVAAIAIGYVTRNIKRKNIFAAVSLVLCLLSLVPYFYDYYTNDMQKITFTNKCTTFNDHAFLFDYYYPETTAYLFATTPPNLNSSVPDITYGGYYKHGTYLHFVYNAPSVADGDYIDVPLYCYPGYRVVYNDAEILTTQRGENDIIRIYLPQGATSGSIRVKYVGLWTFYVGDALTAATIIGIIALPIIRRRKKQNTEQNASKRKRETVTSSASE